MYIHVYDMYIYVYVHVYALYVHVYVVWITWFVEHVCSSDESFFLFPRWTKEELKKVIAMLQNPEFDSKDIDPDLHKRPLLHWGGSPRCPLGRLLVCSPTPCLYVAPAANMVGRVPLIPLFLAGNSTPTIPHKYSKHKSSGFPAGSCDTADADGKRGSNVYEVNQWLWRFARGKPRLGGLSVEETDDRKDATQKVRVERGAETRRRRKADRAWLEMKCGCEQSTYKYLLCLYIVYTCMYMYIPCWDGNSDFGGDLMQTSSHSTVVMHTAMIQPKFTGWKLSK